MDLNIAQTKLIISDKWTSFFLGHGSDLRQDNHGNDLKQGNHDTITMIMISNKILIDYEL